MTPASQPAEVLTVAGQMRERLVAFTAARLQNPGDAEDVVQEAFVRIARGVSALREYDRLESWIYQIARSAIADHQRATVRADRVRARAAADRSLSAPAAGGNESGGSAVLAGCLAPLLAQLPERDRQAIALVEYDGLPQAEAARRAGVSLPGMKSRIQRARARLRALLLTCCQVVVDVRGDVRSIQRLGPCACAVTTDGCR